MDILAFELDALLCDSITEFETTFEWTNTFMLETTFEWTDTSLPETIFNWTDTPQASKPDVTDDPMNQQLVSDIVSTQPFCDPNVQCGEQEQLRERNLGQLEAKNGPWNMASSEPIAIVVQPRPPPSPNPTAKCHEKSDFSMSNPKFCGNTSLDQPTISHQASAKVSIPQCH